MSDETSEATTATPAEPAAAPQESGALATTATGVEPTAAEVSEAVEDGPDAEGRYRITVDGEERKVTFAELRAMAQKGSAADRRMREAAEMRKALDERGRAYDEIAQRLDGDPLLRAYIDGDDETYWSLLAERLEYEQLPPEERAKVDRERERDRKAKAYEDVEKQKAAEAEAAQLQADVQTMGRTAAAALGKLGISPDSPDFDAAIERWAWEASSAIEAGRQITAEQAAERTKAWLDRSAAAPLEELKGLEGDALLARMDELGLTQRFRAADAARLTKRPGRPPPEDSVGKSREDGPRKKRRIGGGELAAIAKGRLG